MAACGASLNGAHRPGRDVFLASVFPNLTDAELLLEELRGGKCRGVGSNADFVQEKVSFCVNFRSFHARTTYSSQGRTSATSRSSTAHRSGVSAPVAFLSTRVARDAASPSANTAGMDETPYTTAVQVGKSCAARGGLSFATVDACFEGAEGAALLEASSAPASRVSPQSLALFLSFSHTHAHETRNHTKDMASARRNYPQADFNAAYPGSGYIPAISIDGVALTSPSYSKVAAAMCQAGSTAAACGTTLDDTMRCFV